MSSSDLPVQIKESEILNLIDRNRALDATYKLLELTLQYFDFTELTKKIADIVPNALGYELGILFLADQKNQKLTEIAHSVPIRDKQKVPAIEAPLKFIDIPQGYQDNLAVKSSKDRLMHVSEKLIDMLTPAITKEQADSIQNTLRLKLVISTPLISREKVIGVLVIGTTKDIDQFTNFEREMISRFSENVGVAMENSKLYDDLKRAKLKLNKAYENLKVLNKMKDEFLTVASHELRTPMTIIKSYLWMLENQKGGNINKLQKDYLRKAKQGTERMINLINDMLDISRFEQKKVTFKTEQVVLSPILLDVIENFRVPAEEKNLKLECTESCRDTSIYADLDKQKFKEIMTNLLGNAIKFTANGVVTIGVDLIDNDYLKVWVRDTGVGVKKENMGKLFHKFARIDNSFTIASEGGGGTGLGLYIVKLYAEGMGGKAGVESEGPGKGSTFWFTLPMPKIHGSIEKEESGQTEVPTQKISSINQSN